MSKSTKRSTKPGTREVAIEKYLRQKVEELGGICEKFVSPGKRGVPDRLITWPIGYMELVELKSPTGTVKKWQDRDHRERKARGIDVYVLASFEEVDRYIAGVSTILERMRDRQVH